MRGDNPTDIGQYIIHNGRIMLNELVGPFSMRSGDHHLNVGRSGMSLAPMRDRFDSCDE